MTDDVPVLTEVVSEESAAPRAADHFALEALAREIECRVLQRLGPEVDRVTEQALEAARAELKASVTRLVREALSASLAEATPKPE
ncbi:MAG TPA: hypothetical protein VJ690_03510 [Burkholderiales bacterium]|nr:hypothetical protein [Burkholderiales bacterium]